MTAPGYLFDENTALGVLVVKLGYRPWKLAEDLHLIWGASLPNEFRDQIVYWPR